MNTTLTRPEDSGEHAILIDDEYDGWDPADDDLSYGLHSLARQFDMAGPRSDKLTVENILARRTPEEILTMNRTAFHDAEYADEPRTVADVLERLAQERLATHAEAEAVLSARRPAAVVAPFWDAQTPTGVILTDYRPDKKAEHDPDETVGFVPMYDKPPIATNTGEQRKVDVQIVTPWSKVTPLERDDHTTVEPFNPIDTRVKQPWYRNLKGWFGLP